VATTTIYANVDNIEPYDQLFLWNESQSDSPVVTHTFPVTFNTAIPSWLRMHFFPAATAFNGDTDRSTQSYGSCGATLISPSYVLMATHCKPTRVWYKQANGTEITRDITTSTDIENDLSVGKLDTPVTTIDPAYVLLDSSVAAGRKAILTETNRMFVVYDVRSDHSNSEDFPQMERVEPVDIPAVALESGDSGHPFVIYFNQLPALVTGGLFGTGAGPFNGQYLYTAQGPNPSHYITEINAYLALGGEELSLLDVRFVQAGGVAQSPFFSPANAPISLLTAMGIV